MCQAEAIALLSGIHETLVAQTDLSPDNRRVNQCLTRLVTTLQAWQAADFGYDLAEHSDAASIARELPSLCGKAECEMEKWWARRILASDCPGAQALAAFWYLDHYQALCRTELSLMEETGSGAFVFLGSGALPLTAILLAKDLAEARITCIDCDGEACELAEQLILRLGLSQHVQICEGDALSYSASDDETVICASLLDAPGLFEHLHRGRTQRVLVRDAEGPYRFCYRPARLPGAEYRQRAKSGLSPLRINTSRYFERVTLG